MIFRLINSVKRANITKSSLFLIHLLIGGTNKTNKSKECFYFQF
jgi:hypothetical protein